MYATPFSINEEKPDLRFGFGDGDSVLFAYSRYIDQHPGGYQAGGAFRSGDGGVT